MRQLCGHLRRVGTDGRDKVKSLETMVIIAKVLKFDLKLCFAPPVSNDESDENDDGENNGGDGEKAEKTEKSENFEREATEKLKKSLSSTEEAEKFVDREQQQQQQQQRQQEQQEPEEEEALSLDSMVQSLRLILAHRSSYLRASGVRAMRYMCQYVDSCSVVFWKYHCHFHLCKYVVIDHGFICVIFM